ncbi:tumor necrosis factor ligand superfamily member 14-like [Thunnus maccoyii]|uniref:tumor necrosis factor ligand superfamily member 14-like n=1 Tax=Thunnus maccoyii TaxID=8240 RepID=UPI001C4D6AB9|nr:tumor necrosis factor ligand superfamily member 14-like [Thunnus maccoyii]XP_042249054.1 tumor necrosis factor ligand superfamily member 14-like [Thunnus maccoyii]
MAEGGHPSVYVVDSHATFPPVPPRLSQGRRRAGVGQTLLFILMSVALCGMTIEACLIYRLYQTESVTSASVSKIIAEQNATAAKLHSPVISPSKPVAHLTDGQDVVHAKDIMAWSTDADPLLYKIDYKDRSLVIQKEGYYYVYSKVSFTDKDKFHHRVDLRTEKFTGKSINLLKSRKYSNHFKHPEQSNSYLGGVFHLSKGDAIFVKVSNTSKIVRQDPSENVFGAYMI